MSDSVVLHDCYVVPAGLRCIRCDHPLTYAAHSFVCKGCDSIFEAIERRVPADSCPECGSEMAWMGGVLVCSPVPNSLCCSQGFVPALLAPPRSCDRCGSSLLWSNRASLCFRCALRAFVELRPGAARIHALENATDDEWRGTVGFGLNDSLWASSGPVAGHPGFGTEFYAVGVGNAAYVEGQLVCALPPWSTTGGPAGTVWLVRICCPSGMVYEVAFPAGWTGDEAVAVNDAGERHLPLPQRLVGLSGISATTIQRELGVARKIVNALPRNPGGQAPIDPESDAAIIIHAIKRLLADGDDPNKSRVGQLIYPHVENPYDSLKKQLARIRERSGQQWEDLLRAAESH